MICKSYCSHGGRCVLEHRHAGKHDSKFCQWNDNEAIPKDEADELIRQKGGAEGEYVVGMTDFLEALLGEN